MKKIKEWIKRLIKPKKWYTIKFRARYTNQSKEHNYWFTVVRDSIAEVFDALVQHYFNNKLTITAITDFKAERIK